MTYRAILVEDDIDMGAPSRTADTIIISSEYEFGQPTGLYDAKGNPIWRFRDPIGYRMRAKANTAADAARS